MNKRILFVDDEEHLLRAVERQLEDDYNVVCAVGPYDGQRTLQEAGPFAVVVADMRMPGMDGISFLTYVRENYPNTVRVMLTGNCDQETAVKAINEGCVYRFINKPASPEAIRTALNDSLSQNRLIEAEKVLLEQTLGGTIQLLSELLATIDPDAFNHSQKLKARARQIGEALGFANIWSLELAAMLFQLGGLAIPASVTFKSRRAGLPEFEAKLMERIPLIGSSLLKKIPRLERVAEAVLYQNKRFDGGGVPDDSRSGEAIPFESRVLKVLNDLDHLESANNSAMASLETMRKRIGWYDPNVLAVAELLFAAQTGREERRSTPISALKPGQVVLDDIVTTEGLMIIPAGQTITQTMLAQLEAYESCGALRSRTMVTVLETVFPKAA